MSCVTGSEKTKAGAAAASGSPSATGAVAGNTRHCHVCGGFLTADGECHSPHCHASQQTEAFLALRNRDLPPAVQRDAGFSLGRIGWKPDDLDKFIAIPAGPFVYGEKSRKVEIKQPFAIAKYPVTNFQWRRFVDAGGYARREWWSDAGWAWRTGTYASKAPEDYRKPLAQRLPEKRGEPFYWHDRDWNNPLAPVVGVTWFEAEAYGNWLTKELGWPMRLPTEKEWERAARHTDGREYPWGDTFDRNRLNCDRFGARSTTIVGQFPEGNSESGVSDTSGNVWEWTCSWRDTEKVYRTVRGGSWDSTRFGTRCANRGRDVPDYWHNGSGFRLVSPGSISGF